MNWTALLFGQVAYLVNFYADLYLQNDLKSMMSVPTFGENINLPIPEEFDFIIVGGGTAGCLVANRLAGAIDGFKVLLLESGGDPPPQTDIPGFAPEFSKFHNIVYDYKTVPQEHVAQSNGGIIDARIGKVLGGTSTLNFMFFNRGSPHDFDNWANLTGDDSWKYDNLLEHFRDIETYAGEFSSDGQHGFVGELRVSTQPYAPGASLFYKAGVELGYERKDPNGPQVLSFTPIEYSKVSGRRMSSYEAFIRRNTRPNLEIRRYSTVEEILLDETKTAYGVRYNRHGFPHVAHARKEIIISAGTFGTAKLLLKSGIGPADELIALNIKPVLDLPVGRNLQDHPYLQFQMQIADNTEIYSHERNLSETTMGEFLKEGTGPLTSVAALSAQAFMASSKATEEGFPDWSDLQLATYFSNRRFLPNPPEIDDHIFAFNIYLGRPRSTGTVKLDPENIDGDPLIDYQMLSDPWDVEIYLDGITKALQVFENTSTFAAVGAKYPETPVEGCETYIFRSEAYWRCYIRMKTGTGAHPTGTCRMGKSIDDSLAVVDPKLRVIGAKNLRVVDASVMPVITNSNIQAAVYAIAQKGAKDILNDHMLRGY